jgi:hypothetical protein
MYDDLGFDEDFYWEDSDDLNDREADWCLEDQWLDGSYEEA